MPKNRFTEKPLINGLGRRSIRYMTSPGIRTAKEEKSDTKRHLTKQGYISEAVLA